MPSRRSHSVHSHYTWNTQPIVYSEYSNFAAEVASNFHQVLLRAHLLATSSDRALRLAVLDEAFANFHRYLFVMPILAAFEREVHECVERGEGVAAPMLVELMADLFAEGFGRDDIAGEDGSCYPVFEWGVFCDSTKLGTGYDLDATLATTRRLNPAHCIGQAIGV